MICLKFIIPQQRKLMGSSAQTGSGVCRCGWQAQVPEGSGAGPGAGCRRRFQKVPEGSGGFRCRAGSGCMCRFQKVPEGSGTGPGANCRRRFRKVPEGCRGFRCRAKCRLQEQVPEGSARFRRRGGLGAEPRQVQQGFREVSGEGLEALVQSHVKFNRVPEKVLGGLGATSASTRFQRRLQRRLQRRFQRRFPEKVWEALVQSHVSFNRFPEKVPEKVWEALMQSQVMRFRDRFCRRFRKVLVRPDLRGFK